MLTIRNETSVSAELYISGDIVNDADGVEIKSWYGNTDGYQFPSDLKRQLDELKGKDLTIYINSYGGSIAAGMAMAHMIERHKGKTTAIVDAYCCSIATQIFFSADVCKMPENAWLMVHKPQSMAFGDSNEMKKVSEVLDTIQDGLELSYRAKKLEDVTDEEIHSMVEAETWLTGAQAAKKFKIELLSRQVFVNCCGSCNKLVSIGARNIPPDLHFTNVDSFRNKKPPAKDDDWLEVEIALARAKGVAYS